MGNGPLDVVGIGNAIVDVIAHATERDHQKIEAMIDRKTCAVVQIAV